MKRGDLFLLCIIILGTVLFFLIGGLSMKAAHKEKEIACRETCIEKGPYPSQIISEACWCLIDTDLYQLARGEKEDLDAPREY